jgi:predicted Fe-S protein YdhL (DUF1289 family)
MIASPCINLCQIDPASGLCAGCLRSLGEIAAWSAADDGERQRILAAVAARRNPTNHATGQPPPPSR